MRSRDRGTSARPGLVLQHGAGGPPDLLERWLRARGLPFDVHHADRDPLPRDVRGRAFVVSLGSQHSPAGGGPPWVDEEVALVRGAVADDVPVLGLCFGGQVLAAALGAPVRRAACGEVGWADVDTDDPALVPCGPWLWFHWDVFAVPPGATEVARSPAGPAAFVLGPHLGVQFHPETGPDVADAWARKETERLAVLGLTADGLLEQGRAVAERAAGQAACLFDAWWARARAARPQRAEGVA